MIEFKNVTKAYKNGKNVLNGLNLSIRVAEGLCLRRLGCFGHRRIVASKRVCKFVQHITCRIILHFFWHTVWHIVWHTVFNVFRRLYIMPSEKVLITF